MGVRNVKTKPLQVEALQYNGGNESEVVEFTNEIAEEFKDEKGKGFIVFYNKEGCQIVNINDWIVKNEIGEFIAIKCDKFWSIYEPS